MNISGIRPEAGFYDNSVVKASGETRRELVNAQRAEASPLEGPAASVDLSSEGIARARARQTFDSMDFASLYKTGETFDMKGEDSDIKSLDVEKAVNAMKRDSILQQYQFFVGSQGTNSDSGVSPRGGEDFTL